MTDVQVLTSPEIMVVLGEGRDAQEHLLQYADVVVHLETPPEPGMVDDATLVQLVARYMDRDVGDFGSVQVSRPAEGRILIGPKPVFGAWIWDGNVPTPMPDPMPPDPEPPIDTDA